MLDEVKHGMNSLLKFPNVIEYVDKEEEQNIMLAVFPEYIDKAHKIMMKEAINDLAER